MKFNLKKIFAAPPLSPKKGYARWAENYESSNNLMHVLDEQIVRELLKGLNLSNKVILDYGCGSGRYWPLLKEKNPAAIVGCDPSPEMLAQLHKKYPAAETHFLKNQSMPFQADHSVDLLFSTLAIGHIARLKDAFREWRRVAKKDAFLLFTGNHPSALKSGVKRTFHYQGKNHAIKNYIHEHKKIRKLLDENGWREITFLEERVSERRRSYFEAADALNSFYQIKGKPVVYGMLFEKLRPNSF